ncbi:MAG: choice-of-anchor Q domain-containing protein [Gemmataceae bacterium]
MPDGTHLLTMVLQKSSPAVDAGSDNGFVTDERGAGYPRVLNGGQATQADIGAVEGLDPQPHAFAVTGNVAAAGNANYIFTVTYTDDTGFNTTTFDTNDVTLTGPGYPAGKLATSVGISGGASTYTVSYTVPAPLGGWGGVNVGTYTITLNANQVSDLSSNFVAGGQLATFRTAFGTTLQVNNASDIDDGNYGSGQFSFREALSLANLNSGYTDSITFDPAVFSTASTITLTAGPRAISDSLVITGPTASLSFDANNTNQQFAVAANQAVAISKLTFTRFTAASSGAVLAMSSGSVTLLNVSFSSNTATSGDGGVFYMSNQAASGPISATVSNCTFVNNTASTGDGGAIAISSNGSTTVSIDSSTFTGNTSGSRAGAVALHGIATVSNCTFTSNSTKYNGGALISGSSTTITGSTFVNNSAYFPSSTSYGGATFLGGSDSVSNCSFIGNYAGTSGGAMFLGNTLTTATVTACLFSNNVAGSTSAGGGAVGFGGSCTATLANCDFNLNSTTGAGGAIYSPSGSVVTVTANSFRGNSAAMSGGAIAAARTFATAFTINQSTFNHNTAAGTAGGGAINLTSAGALSINNSTIADNTATGGAALGGGIARTSSGGLTLVSTIVALNHVANGTNGVDIYSNSTVSLDASTHHNLIGSNTGSNFSFADISTNQLGAAATPINPMLSPLADYGGVLLPDSSHVQTMAIQVGSPAINRGTANGFTVDERGPGYPRTIGKSADVGAFESPFVPPTVTSAYFSDGSGVAVTQRSLVKQLVVTFSEAVNFMGGVAAAFTVHRAGTGGTTGDVTLVASPANGPAVR